MDIYFQGYHTDWQRREKVLLHVKLCQVPGSGKDSVGYSVTLVVLHVEGLSVDELSRAAGGKRAELIPGNGDGH